MKRKSSNAFYSFGLLLFVSISAFAQETRKVAVFDPAGKVDEALLEIVREEISSVVVNTAGYTVLERQLINKVLEENKFQESGLVNDEQMSDIGKRMGADYVFVTAISMLGKNYYISCKMIEVATARIDKQSTGTTTNGINDIPQTTQAIVKRLFVENVRQQAVNKQQEQTEKSVQTAEKQRDTATAENETIYDLIQKKSTVDKVNDTNKAALNKKKSSSKPSQFLIITGSTLIPAGIAATILLRKDYVEFKDAKRIRGKEYNLVYAASGIVTGSVCIGVGVALKKKAKNRVDLVTTDNGLGLRLTF